MAREQYYVAPSRLKEHLTTLFDAMVASQTRLKYDLEAESFAFFRPEGVEFKLSRFLGGYRHLPSYTRCYLEAVVAVRVYLQSCCIHGMIRNPERVKGEALDMVPVLDDKALEERDQALQSGILAPSTVDEVYESIRSIPEVSFKEQSDYLTAKHEAQCAYMTKAWEDSDYLSRYR